MPQLSRKLKKGSRAAYRLLGAGPHGWRGLPPNVLKKVTAYVLPVFAFVIKLFYQLPNIRTS